MPGQETRLSNPDQLDEMSQAHRAHGDAAHTVGDQVATGHGALLSLENWGGAGYDDVSQVLQQLAGHMHSFGDLKHRMAEATQNSKTDYLAANQSAADSMTPDK